MKAFGTLVALLPLLFGAYSALAAGPDNDPHPLANDEIATFLPLVCKDAVEQKDWYGCADLIRYPRDPADPDPKGPLQGQISLDALATGAFSGAGADEAYLSYSSDQEGASDNSGGGILFRRTNGNWEMVQWIPGGQMNSCIALPGDGPQRMLCLDGGVGQGEADTMVHVAGLKGSDGKYEIDTDDVLKAQDGRAAVTPGEVDDIYCAKAVPTGKAMLLSIDTLERFAINLDHSRQP